MGYSNWSVDIEPEGKNDGKNEGGMIVTLTKGASREEVSRVGFVRRNSNNPRNSFEHQLDLELEKAKHAASILNESRTGGLA